MLVLFFLVNISMAEDMQPVFKIEPLTLSFVVPNNRNDETRLYERTVFGNFPKSACVLLPNSNAHANASPLLIMQEILYIFNKSKNYEDILHLVSPSLSKDGMDFYLNQIKNPQFAEVSSRINSFSILGYFLYGENKCSVLYKINDRKICFSYIFVFENGQWYLANQLEKAGDPTGLLSTFYDFYGDNNSENINIKVPPNMEDFIALSKDTAVVTLYEKLALTYNWKSFSAYINESAKDFVKSLNSR